MFMETRLLKWIILGIFSVAQVSWARSPGTYFQLRNDLNKISSKNLNHWVNEFVKASSPSRMVGKPGHDKAQAWIESEIKKIDPKSSGKLVIREFTPDISEAKRLYQSDFDEKVEGKFPKTHPDYQKWSKFTQHMLMTVEKLAPHKGKNIIWEKQGLSSDKMLVITAHYDTISHDQKTMLIKENDVMPGANYNASGVAVGLGLIKTMVESDLNYSVQVVFLDWQGPGFLGSFQHAKELKSSGKEILGVINLEMLGQDTSFFDKTKKLGNMKVYTRNNPDEVKWVNKIISHGPKITEKVSFEPMSNSFSSSDNFRYWDQGFKAATFTQNWEDDFNPKFYQTPQDTPETLNHETLHYGYQYLGGVVIGTLLDITK